MIAPRPRARVDRSRPPTATILAGLQGAVRNPRGTASTSSPASRRQSTIAGKTGTAQVAGKQDTSLFVGNDPPGPGQPQYVVVTMVEQGASVPTSAAPIVAARHRAVSTELPLSPIASPSRRARQTDDDGTRVDPHAGGCSRPRAARPPASRRCVTSTCCCSARRSLLERLRSRDDLLGHAAAHQAGGTRSFYFAERQAVCDPARRASPWSW